MGCFTPSYILTLPIISLGSFNNFLKPFVAPSEKLCLLPCSSLACVWFLTGQWSSLGWRDGSCVVHPSKKSQFWSISWGELVLPLMSSPACSDSRASVGGLGLLSWAQVVEVSAIRAWANGTIQAHGALAWLLGLALARPHVQTWVDTKIDVYSASTIV